jgi:hypothetical protein
MIIVAESPPASGKYFYDTTGRTTEPLFRALMKTLLDSDPAANEDGLRAFQAGGYLLVDATYTPVNAGLTVKERDKAILSDYSRLTGDLLNLTPDRKIPLLLIKANVCRLLAPRLTEDGFRVINGSKVVPFPSHGNQARFYEKVGEFLGAL